MTEIKKDELAMLLIEILYDRKLINRNTFDAIRLKSSELRQEKQNISKESHEDKI